MFSRFPFHSILLSAYPILHLFSVNIVFIAVSDIYRSLAVSIGVAIFFLLGFFAILRNWEKAGALCSLLIVMFFSFGHIVNALAVSANPLPISGLIWVWIFLFFLLGFFAIKLKAHSKFTLFMNIVVTGLTIFPLFAILSTTISTHPFAIQRERDKLADIRGQSQAESTMPRSANQPAADIYMIILDSYERSDVLKNFYGIDNSAFIQALEQRGFFIASESHSNFLNTTYSLNTTLNLVYFNQFPGNLIRNARYNLQTNYVSDFLRRQGYQIVVFDSGTGDSNNQYADRFISPQPSNAGSTRIINAFEELLIRTTMGVTLLKSAGQSADPANAGVVLASTINQTLDAGRERIRNTLQNLPDFAADASPQFLFAHIYSPHIPFLYGPGGAELKYQKDMSLYWYEPAPEDYVEKYGYQIEYLNQAVLATIDRILTESTVPPIIILQSDHGDDHYLDWQNPTAQGIDLRSSILNAIYLPDGNYSSLYPTITSVNTFRVVFNHQFGTSYPLLADKVFFHEHSAGASRTSNPRFLDACASFEICLPDNR